MKMWNTLTFMTEQLGMNFENVILIVLVIGSLVFFAKDFRLGALILFILSGAVSMWFYNAGMDYVNPLIVMFLDLIVLCFTLFAQNNNPQGFM